MNEREDLDRALRAWLHDDAARRAPGGLLETVVASTGARRPRSGWSMAFRTVGWNAWASGIGRSRRGLLVMGVLAALVLGLIAGLVIGVGSSRPTATGPAPSRLPASRGVFVLTGSMSIARESPTATLLNDGRVLVVGGYGGGEDSAEIWDPATGSFSAAGLLIHGRHGHTATLLQDGRVLIVGGDGLVGRVPEGLMTEGQVGSVAEAEIWDPTTLTFSPAGRLGEPRSMSMATLQPDGRVRIEGGLVRLAGGSRMSSNVAAQTTELWDPATMTFGPGPRMPGPPHVARVALADGRIFLFGGWHAEVWDPTTSTTTPTGSPVLINSAATLTRLQDGRVLVISKVRPGEVPGGRSGSAAEIWDPATGAFATTGSTINGRYASAAVLLADGRVLVVGDDFNEPSADTAEVFGFR